MSTIQERLSDTYHYRRHELVENTVVNFEGVDFYIVKDIELLMGLLTAIACSKNKTVTVLNGDSTIDICANQIYVGEIDTYTCAYTNSINCDFGDIDWWDVRKFNKLYQFFTNNEEFNGDISTWNVHNLRSTSRVFSKSYNQDLWKWGSTIEYRLREYGLFDKSIDV